MTVEKYPLHWPAGWPRKKYRASAAFALSFADARDHLFSELARMGARYIVLSTNVELRRDGIPYATFREPSDPGVAVYFEWKGKQMTFACDRWNKTKDNIRAIGKTIEALRGIERWGASDMMERAFSAFEALPRPSGQPAPQQGWWIVLGVARDASVSDINRAYREKAKSAHPDACGTVSAITQLNLARDQGLAEKRA